MINVMAQQLSVRDEVPTPHILVYADTLEAYALIFFNLISSYICILVLLFIAHVMASTY